jgi:2-phosphosulfolactate phosphatase
MEDHAVDEWTPLTAHRQMTWPTRFEWGLAGAEALASDVSIAVVVDVLSFTTALSVAVDAGTAVLPYGWQNDDAVAYAADRDAVLAVHRADTRPGDISLSPQSIREAPPVARLVLPSPNGSTIAHRLARAGATVVGASLRNAAAVAGWIADHHDPSTPMVVIAAGEHWPNGALRPAIEDLWGAGAILHHLHDLGWTDLSPEAEVARKAFAGVAADIPGRLRACASGRELIDAGFPSDVEIAAEMDESRSVPILREGAFVSASSPM